MAVSAPQLTTSQQKKYFKVRTDLEITKQSHRGETCYIIKDPLALRYFRLSEVEFRVFTLLDGAHSIEDIQRIIHEEFADIELTNESISQFLLMLKQVNFLERMYAKESRLLYDRAQKRKAMFSLSSKLKNIFFFKVSLWDPDRFLDWTLPYVRFIFTKPFGYVCALIMAVALWIGFMSTSTIAEQLSGILTFRNLVFFWVVFVIVKMFHELGHAYTCKYYGGEVHELGILLMFFTPCLYCDVSDAWIFQRKRDRLWVSGAGIFVELFLAGVACIVWKVSEPGLLKTLSYNTMFLCSVSSIFFNANPLMKFDGYYMLSDYLEMPNLRNKSIQRLAGLLKKFLLGMDVPEDEIKDPDNRLYVVYALASSLYIYIFIFAIAGFTMSQIYILGLYMFLSMFIGLLLFPLRKMITFLAKNRRNMKIKRHRLYVLGAIGVIILGFFFLYRLDYKLKNACVIEPSARVEIRAPWDGFIEQFDVVEGQRVEKGGVIAVLKNRDIERNIADCLANIEVKKRQIDKANGEQDLTAAQQYKIEKVELEKELEEFQAIHKDLTIRAPFACTILIPAGTGSRGISLRLNKGRFVKKGETICGIGDIEEVMVRAVVNDADIRDVQTSAPVALRMYAYPHRTFEGAVTKKSPATHEFIDSLPLLHPFGGEVVVKSTGEPIEKFFEVDISISNQEGLLKPGMTGWAKIYAGRKTLGERLWAFIKQKAQVMFRIG
jgi:putative peptide zinc metalloprotease protein